MAVNAARGQPDGEAAHDDDEVEVFNLDKIPQTIHNVNQNLVRFTGYMLESYNVQEQDLPMLQGTKFTEVREQVCQQATLYNYVVSPFGQNVLQDTSAFFSEFIDNYEDIEDLKDGIEFVIEDTQVIVHGFDISRQIHEPILTQAEINKLKANAVMNEIQDKEIGIGQEFRKLEQ